MKYQGIKKIHEGKFITRYDVDYITAEGRTKTYEIISRNKSIHSLEELQNHKADSVVMILTDHIITTSITFIFIRPRFFPLDLLFF